MLARALATYIDAFYVSSDFLKLLSIWMLQTSYIWKHSINAIVIFRQINGIAIYRPINDIYIYRHISANGIHEVLEHPDG